MNPNAGPLASNWTTKSAAATITEPGLYVLTDAQDLGDADIAGPVGAVAAMVYFDGTIWRALGAEPSGPPPPPPPAAGLSNPTIMLESTVAIHDGDPLDPLLELHNNPANQGGQMVVYDGRANARIDPAPVKIMDQDAVGSLHGMEVWAYGARSGGLGIWLGDEDDKRILSATRSKFMLGHPSEDFEIWHGEANERAMFWRQIPGKAQGSCGLVGNPNDHLVVGGGAFDAGRPECRFLGTANSEAELSAADGLIHENDHGFVIGPGADDVKLCFRRGGAWKTVALI